MRVSKTYNMTAFGQNWDIRFSRTTYTHDGSLAVLLEDRQDEKWEPFGVLTVNLCHPLQGLGQAFVDSNNMPQEMIAFLKKAGLIKSTGIKARSGWCEYELYDMTALVKAIDNGEETEACA